MIRLIPIARGITEREEDMITIVRRMNDPTLAK